MYLVVVSEAAGLGPNFHRWINDISCDIRYIIKVNVFFSKPFQIECSVHKSCPLSPIRVCVISRAIAAEVEWGFENIGRRVVRSQCVS